MPDRVDVRSRFRQAVPYVTGAVAVELVASVIMAGFATWLLWRGFGGSAEMVLDDFVWGMKNFLGKILLVDLIRGIASSTPVTESGYGVFEAISYVVAIVVVVVFKGPARDIVEAVR